MTLDPRLIVPVEELSSSQRLYAIGMDEYVVRTCPALRDLPSAIRNRVIRD